ncbi:MAG: hypothetical protein EBR87_08870, partial [Cytophagia bacterium]|nr:hypothetical protein [Cytophagia bacterium]
MNLVFLWLCYHAFNQANSANILAQSAFTQANLDITNISTFISTILTKLDYLEKYGITRSPDVRQTNIKSITIPVDLINNNSVEISASFRFYGNWIGTRLWTEYYDDYNNNLTYFNEFIMTSYTTTGNYFENWRVEGGHSGMLMFDMSTDSSDPYYSKSNTLKIRLYRPLDGSERDPRRWSFDGNSLWNRSGSSRARGVFSGCYDYRPRSIAFWTG